MYFDATLTPEVCELTLFDSPDVRVSRNCGMQYVMVPYRRDAVRFVQVAKTKHSRKFYGIRASNRKPVMECGGYREPTAVEMAGYERVRGLDYVNAITDFYKRKGERVLVVAPKQITPGNEASEPFIHKLDPVEYRKVDGEVLPGILTAGSVAGMNGYEDANVLLIVSQGFSEKPRDHENIAIALTGRSIDRIGLRYQTDDVEDYALNDTTGRYIPSSRPVHPDPIAEAVRWMSQEGQVIQSIDRARGVRRMRDGRNGGKLLVICANRLLLGFPNTEHRPFKDIMPRQADFLRASGIEIEDASKYGVYELVNSMMPERLKVGDKTWRRKIAAEFRIEAARKAWNDTIVTYDTEGGRTCKLRMRTNEAGRERLHGIGARAETTVSAEDCVLDALETCAAQGIDFITLKGLGSMITERTGAEKPPSSKRITEAVLELAQPQRFVPHRRKSGSGILIRPDGRSGGNHL